MLFNSFRFLIFFPVVTAVYFLLPFRARWFWLLAASCYFYMCFIPVYILILFFTITVDYVAARAMERTSGGTRRSILLASIVANVGVLAVFKYFNFLNANFSQLAHLIAWNYPIPMLKIILPIGLSFHTFQSLSYTIEVYRGNQKAEHHFGIFALYVMFYPQLVAGPIERPQNLLHQFYEEHRFNYERFRSGIVLMAWGLFKKVVVADRVSTLVDQVYNHPSQFQGVALLAATFFFAVQIYCDFSGYSDIARGCAQVMGFRLMENFRSPYFSESIAEFWKRWHISLSTWFRDYVYIPLGGRHVTKSRWVFNLLLTFMLSGLWHGANWTFVCWGLLHGCFVGLYYVKGDRFHLWRPLRALATFAVVCVSWVFFRASNVSDALYILRHQFSNLLAPMGNAIANLGLLRVDWIVVAVTIPVLFGIEKWSEKQDWREILLRQNAVLRWTAYAALVFVIVVFGVFREAQFIYFQF